MATLITKVRELTSCTDTSVFSDEQVQAFLDRHRIELRYVYLCEIETRIPGGSVEYKTFQLEGVSPRMLEGNAGSDADQLFLYDSGYNALTSTAEDLVNGRWSFATQPTMPVMLLAWAYDVYAAAVDLLEEWAGKLRSASGQAQILKAVEDNGQRFEWGATGDAMTSITGLLETYRSRMCLESVSIADADHLPWQ